MNRTLIAAGFAAAMLPALAAEASAGSFDELKRSYTLGCAVNQTDGVSLKSGMIIITNKSPHTIPQGTRIEIVVIRRAFRGLQPVAHHQVAFRYVPARDTIAFSQPLGQLVSCTARASFQPHIKAKVESKIEKIGRR